MTTFYSFPANFGEGPRNIHIPIIGRLTARSIIDEVEDILLAPPSMPVIVASGIDMERASALEYAVDHIMGEAMARHMRADMVLNHFFPIPTNTEDLAALYEAMGITPLDGTEAGGYLSSGVLLGQAKTLRQRCFARLFSGFDKASGSIRLMYASASGAKIKPFANTLRSLMPACYRNKKLRKSLASIPIASGPGRTNGNPELVGPLQDLADIITYEIRLAYEDDYYPGMPDVDPMTEEHVDQVMVTMQREIDREQRLIRDDDGVSRNKVTVHLPDLPKERKTALAERRRHWFGVFGITPKSWKK